MLGQHTAELPWNNDHILRVVESVEAVGSKEQMVTIHSEPEYLKAIPQVNKFQESKDYRKDNLR